MLFAYVELCTILCVLYVARSIYVFQSQRPTAETLLQRWNATFLANIFEQCHDPEYRQTMIELPSPEKFLIVQGLVFVAAWIFILRHQKKKASAGMHDQDKRPATMTRLLINLSVVQITFIATAFCQRELSVQQKEFSMQSLTTTPRLLIPSQLPSNWWALLRDMFYLSHPHPFLWLTHVAFHCATFFIAFAPSWRVFLKGLIVGDILLLVAFATHGMVPTSNFDETYCLRNTFLATWDQASWQHIIAHAGTQLPLSFLTLIGLS